MFIEQYKQSIGKSKAKQSLFEHTFQCLHVAARIFERFGTAYQDFSKQKIDQILFSVFVHDVGKLNKDFQDMLGAIVENKQPTIFVKHEGFTPNFAELLSEGETEICQFIVESTGWKITHLINLDIAIAFALTHHGIYYLSVEQKEGSSSFIARREILRFNENEIRRITLSDLLFTYHPFGGLVIIADQIASYCHETEKDFEEAFGKAESFDQLLESLIDIQKDINQIYDREKHPSPNIKPMLQLLLGGIR